MATHLEIRHLARTIGTADLGSGDLAERAPVSIAPATEWWPFRNQLLLTVAGMVAVDLGVSTLIVGCVASDAFHRDGTSDFIDAMSRCMSIQEGNIEITAPAIELTSAELVRRSGIPASLLMWSHSCHVANYARGSCRGCLKHLDVIHLAGMMG